MHPSDEKFLQSKLPQRKLEIALERLFPPNQEPFPIRYGHMPGGQPAASRQNPAGLLPPEWQKTYSDYIRTRVYPALLLLAGQKDYERMQSLLSTGWADAKLRLRLLQEEQIKDVQIRAMLLTAEQTAFEDCGVNTEKGAVSPALSSSQNSSARPDYKNLLSGPALFTLWGRRLGLEHPALRNVLSSLRFQEVADRQLPGTDGETIFYHPAQLEELAASGLGYPAYLHMIVHCLFLHILPPGETDRQLWSLACDIAASVLTERIFPGLFSKIWYSDKQLPEDPFPGRQSADQEFFSKTPADRKKELRVLLNTDEQFPISSAAAVFHLLECDPKRAEALMGRFILDDHSRWEPVQKTNVFRQSSGKDPAKHTDGTAGRFSCSQNHAASAPQPSALSQSCRQDMLRRWARAANDHKGGAGASSPRFGLMPGSRQDRMEKKEEGQYNFGRYLKRFSVTGEEMQLDTDSFDYIPYHYGMEHYGSLPFLEPLEYTETSKVEELVIAIDTSGSCSLQLVRRFLGETRKMLTEKEHFFTRMRVHIFQCDSMIQDYRLIHSREEWSRYEDRLSIAGRGGTNFTPVFDRVGQMLKAGSIKKLKGLLYFSDGDGIYPQEKPSYETAFIFPDFRFLELRIPPWVVKLCLKSH